MSRRTLNAEHAEFAEEKKKRISFLCVLCGLCGEILVLGVERYCVLCVEN